MAPRPWRPPDTALGRFVGEKYETPQLQRRVFNRLKRNDFTPPGAQPTYELPETPLGEYVGEHWTKPGTQRKAFRALSKRPGLQALPFTGPDGQTSLRLTTPGQRKLTPTGFVNTPGVKGPFGKPPRLNPDQWEVTQNEYGQYFARPRTELTGLDPQSVADIKGFDRQTGAQEQRITQSYDAYATQAGADRDAGAAALGNLARLSAAGFADASSGQPAPGPYGGVAAPGLSVAERALPGVLAQGARETSAARSAQTIAGMNQLPTLARSEGLGARTSYTATRQAKRTDFVSGLRELIAEQQSAAAAAAAKESQFRRTAALQARGQNLGLIGNQLGSQTTLATNAQDNATTIATTNANNASRAGREGTSAQADAQAEQYRTPRQIRSAAGRTIGPWKVRPAKPPKGATLEQGTDGRWYAKVPTGSGGASGGGGSRDNVLTNSSTRQRLSKELQGRWQGATDRSGKVTREGWNTWDRQDVAGAEGRLRANLIYPKEFQVARWVAANERFFRRGRRLHDADVRRFLEDTLPEVQARVVIGYLDRLL